MLISPGRPTLHRADKQGRQQRVEAMRKRKRLQPMAFGPIRRLWAGSAELVDRRVGWASLRPLLGAVTLGGLRLTLRRKNLHDTDRLPSTVGLPAPPDPFRLPFRSAD